MNTAESEGLLMAMIKNERDRAEAAEAERDKLWNKLGDTQASESILWHALEDLLDNGGWGHGHWDSTQQHGAGCALCQEQRDAKARAREVLARRFAAEAPGG